MFFGEINIPDELHVALQEGDVVVFAGAGVSVAPPSSLPLFDGLAERIGEGSGIVREGKHDAGSKRFEYDEPADRYLGRLERKKVKVHERAAELLVGGDTLPHTLHRALLQLFSTSEKVRLVTTNFDTHFSTAAKELGIGVASEFHAPALPLGNDFYGLVYLHGCAALRPLRLVLTDEDFGRAYLTEGWVRRFLVSMFARYTVVFVGYSHNDPVMNYLARGLPPEHRNRRFAFVVEGEEESWRHLDIIPLAYPGRDGSSNPHEALVVSVTRWVAFSKETLLERARKIRKIAGQKPPLDIETDGQLHLAIKHAAMLQPFVETARMPEWIRWVEEKGMLTELFGTKKNLSEELAMLVNWLVGSYLYEHPQALLALMHRNLPNSLHPQFCERIAARLLYSEAPPENMLALWSAVLLYQPDDVMRQERWGMLLGRCQFPRDKAIIGQLFQRASKPELALRKYLHFGVGPNASEKEVDFEIKIDLHAVHYLRESWNDLISKNLNDLTGVLEPIVTLHLSNVRGALVATGKAWGESDVVCFSRVSIEPNGGRSGLDGMDFLIDTAREILRHLQVEAPDRAYTIILNWFKSGVPILRRLAVHAMGRQPDRTPEQRVGFVTERGLLFDSVCQHEVLLLLRLNYSHLLPASRASLLDLISVGPTLVPERDDDEDRQYTIFTLLAWLHSVDGSCEQARAKLDAIQARFPKFQVPTRVDVDGWSVAPARVVALNSDEILRQPPEQFLEDLLELPMERQGSRSREDYACNLWTLVPKNRMWGLEFQKAARIRRLEDKSIWHQLANAWREAKPVAEEWELIIQEFDHPDTSIHFLGSIVEVLKYWVKREGSGMPANLLSQAADIAHRAWRDILSKIPGSDKVSTDWLQEAINRTGGDYAELLLEILNQQRPSLGDAWGGIPEPMRERLVEIACGSCAEAEHGRVILAAQLRWLYGIDRDFAELYLLPLFDWSIDERRAEQCWHGFLQWGNWALNYKDRLLPLFNETVRRISTPGTDNDGEFQTELANHIARLAWYVLDNPLSDSWVLERLKELRPQGRTEFAQNIEQVLEDSDLNVASIKWDSWLERYWNLRVNGIPLPLNPEEANHMVGWAINMPGKFSEAMKLVASMQTIATFQQIMLLDRIAKKNLIEIHPFAAAQLILMYLNTKPVYLRADDYLKKVWQKLRNSALPDEVMAKLNEALVAARIDPDKL